jgi:hypothetical protein
MSAASTRRHRERTATTDTSPGRAHLPREQRHGPDQEEPATLPELLRDRARDNPDQPAVVIGPPGIRRQAMSYAELFSAAHALSGHLTMHLEVRERALILLDRGALLPTAMFAALIAGLVAIPASVSAFARDRSLARHLLDQCRPEAILTTRAAFPLLEDGGFPLILLDELTGGAPQQARRRPLPADPAYVEHAERGAGLGCRTITHQHALALLAGGRGREPYTTEVLAPIYHGTAIHLGTAKPPGAPSTAPEG